MQIDTNACFKDLMFAPYVEEIQDFHVWVLSADTLAMSAHIKSSKPKISVREMNKILRNSYGIQYTTIQTEEMEEEDQP